MQCELASGLSDAVYELTRINMNRRLNSPFKASEVGAMLYIAEKTKQGETVQPSDIASHFSISKAWVTAIVHSLTAGGYVVQQQGDRDRRTKTLTASAKGEAIVDELRDDYISDYLQVIGKIGPEEAGNMLRLISLTIEALKEIREEDPSRRNDPEK
ncbi:MAG: MarR family transcriptional regulator [Clostridia bacterium]|nr:MarR family transcriptional regulator [Clostridia bacterium]